MKTIDAQTQPSYLATRSYADALALLQELQLRVKQQELNEAEVICLMSETDFHLLTNPSFALLGSEIPLTQGMPLSEGAVVGRIFSSLDQLLADVATGPKILLCARLHNKDLCHFPAIAGVLATHEDPSSHASIVARVQGKPILTGVPMKLPLHPSEPIVFGDSQQISEGTWISMDAFAGNVYLQRLPMVTPTQNETMRWFLDLLAKHSPLVAHANADTAAEVRLALHQGARGYEPRLEHLLLQEEALLCLQTALLAQPAEESVPLNRLQACLRAELRAVYQAAQGRPVHVRLLDPPIHEFLPHDASMQAQVAANLQVDLKELHRRMEEMREVNPMMGLRGVRLLLKRPHLAHTQIAALFQAAMDHASVSGHEICPSITLPMVVDVQEVIQLRAEIEHVRHYVAQERGFCPSYRLGVMLETPRAALLADQIAPHIDFVSFGTNDLTAQVFAFSRGDVFAKFLGTYLETHILKADPFLLLDDSVRELMQMAILRLRARNPAIRIGTCGEHASHKETLAFCMQHGFHSVSVSPALIPRTLFHAAQLAYAKEKVST